MYIEPVATPTLSVAKVATLMDAPAEVIQKGMQTVLKPVVADWRKVDAVGLVAALIGDPAAVAMLEKILTKLPKGCQILGVDWVEESRLVAR
jgi:membrane protein required for beta-lactamase induction